MKGGRTKLPLRTARFWVGTTCEAGGCIAGILRGVLSGTAGPAFPRFLSLLSLAHLRRGDAPSLGNSLGERQGGVLLARESRELLPENTLHLLVKLNVVLRDHCQSAAGPAGACGPPNAVDVVLGIGRNVIVHNQIHRRHVQSASGHFCRHKACPLARLEFRECRQALRLWHLAVYGERPEPEVAQ